MNIVKVNKTVKSEQQENEILNEQRKEIKDGQSDFQTELNALLIQNNINLDVSDRNLLINTAKETGSINLNSTRILSWARDLNDIKSEFNYNTMTMDKEDAQFFINLTQNIPAQVSVSQNQVDITTLEITETSGLQKSLKTSKILNNIIENCYKTGQSARIDFDNNISVIMRIDREGKVTAQFIPSDNIAEQYLKNNIGLLRQTFEEQNLPYNELSYREQNKNRNSNNRNKDKEHE